MNPVFFVCVLNNAHYNITRTSVTSFAPWCPACKQFSGTWEQFGRWAAVKREDLQVGKVDVTAATSMKVY